MYRRVGHPRGDGFTLVELLVVIGIIAVLISILLPVLNRVRESGRRTKCLSNLRQLAASIHAYANDHQQSMPIPAVNWSAPWHTYLAWDDTGYRSPGVAGRLVDGRVMTMAAMYYCPAFEESASNLKDYSLATYRDSFWPPETRRVPPEGRGKVRTSYNFVPYCGKSATGSYTTGLRFLKLPKYPSRLPMVIDMLAFPNAQFIYPHFMGSAKGFNAARADGSASWYDATKMAQVQASIPNFDSGHSWSHYEQLLEALVNEVAPPGP